jgi:hypothetical protein
LARVVQRGVSIASSSERAGEVDQHALTQVKFVGSKGRALVDDNRLAEADQRVPAPPVKVSPSKEEERECRVNQIGREQSPCGVERPQ